MIFGGGKKQNFYFYKLFGIHWESNHLQIEIDQDNNFVMLELEEVTNGGNDCL